MPESNPVDEMANFIREAVSADLGADVEFYGIDELRSDYKIVKFFTQYDRLKFYVVPNRIYIALYYTRDNTEVLTETSCTYEHFKTDHKAILNSILDYHNAASNFAQILDGYFQDFASEFGIKDIRRLVVHSEVDPTLVQSGKAKLVIRFKDLTKRELNLAPILILNSPTDYAHNIFEDIVYKFGKPTA